MKRAKLRLGKEKKTRGGWGPQFKNQNTLPTSAHSDAELRCVVMETVNSGQQSVEMWGAERNITKLFSVQKT